jgi:hypothetical protein
MGKSHDSKLKSKWQDLKDAFKKWSRQSTLHGYSNVFDTDRTIVRVMWLACIAISISLCSFLIINSFIEYFKFDSSNSFDVIYEKYSTFPAITICPSNFFLTRYSKNLVLEYLKNKTNTTIRNLGDLKRVYSFKDEKLKEDILALRDTISSPSFSEQQKQAIGYNYSQLFISCTFNSHDCNTSHIIWYFDFVYGNCFRINTGFDVNGNTVPLLNQYEGGLSHGLSLKLFTGGIENDLRNYFNVQESFGSVISVDNQTYMPMSSVENILRIETGTCSYVGLKKTVIKKLPSPFSECVAQETFKSIYYNEFLKINKSYTQQACFLFCKQRYIVDKCNCYSRKFPGVSNTRLCLNTTDERCVSHYLNIMNLNEECLDNCPPQCDLTNYDFYSS